MIIEIHMIQNHAAANLNRDDLGAPKTCYFGGVLRSRISSQCLKRSIRMSKEFEQLIGGVRTRRLAELIANEFGEESDKFRKNAISILEKCGIKSSDTKTKKKEEESEDDSTDTQKDSKMLVYTSTEAIKKMAQLLKELMNSGEEDIAKKFAYVIAKNTAVPDIALSGRMLEPSGAGEIWKGLNKTVEASLQVAHAFSTHEAHPEVDYFVAADDIPGEDAGAGYLDETMFSSACFYKYFSINWEQLLKNLNNNEKLAIHTVTAFIRAAATTNPSGKQNSFAAHNFSDGILIEIRDSPVSYANAFAEPVSRKSGRSIIEQSIAQLGQYVNDIHTGYGNSHASMWFSPNLKFTFDSIVSEDNQFNSLDKLIEGSFNKLIKLLGLDISWLDAANSILEESNRLSAVVKSWEK